MAAYRKSDRRRVYLCAVGLRKTVIWKNTSLNLGNLVCGLDSAKKTIAESHIGEAGRREQTVVVILDYTGHTRAVATIRHVWESKLNRFIDCSYQLMGARLVSSKWWRHAGDKSIEMACLEGFEASTF